MSRGINYLETQIVARDEWRRVSYGGHKYDPY